MPTKEKEKPPIKKLEEKPPVRKPIKK